jgi:hypothetical protein
MKEKEEYVESELTYIEIVLGKYQYFLFGTVFGFIAFFTLTFMFGLTKGSKSIDINNKNK